MQTSEVKSPSNSPYSLLHSSDTEDIRGCYMRLTNSDPLDGLEALFSGNYEIVNRETLDSMPYYAARAYRFNTTLSESEIDNYLFDRFLLDVVRGMFAHQFEDDTACGSALLKTTIGARYAWLARFVVYDRVDVAEILAEEKLTPEELAYQVGACGSPFLASWLRIGDATEQNIRLNFDATCVDYLEYAHRQLHVDHAVWYSYAVACGMLEVASWACRLPNIQLDSPYLLKAAARQDNTEILKLVLRMYGEADANELVPMFITMCRHGNMSSARYMYESGWIDIDDVRSPVVSDLLIENGNIEMMQWAITIGLCDEQILYGAFRYAVDQNDLQMVKAIAQIDSFDIGTVCDTEFEQACESGYLLVAQWLWQVGAKHIKDETYVTARVLADHNEHKDVVEWVDGMNIIKEKLLDDVFCLACDNGHLGVAKGIYRLDPAVVERTYGVAMSFGKTADWLSEVGGVD